MDVDVGVNVKNDKEAMAQFLALNRELDKLYGEGLNLRQPVQGANTVARGLRAVGRELRDVVSPALSGLGVTLGLGAGAFAASMYGLVKVSREFGRHTVDQQYLAKELGQSVQEMRGFAAAASEHGIGNDQAISALQSFGEKADSIRQRTGEMRQLLTGWGEGGLVQSIMNSKTNAEALAATLERMDALRETAPDRARFLSESLLGDYRFINMSLRDVRKWTEQSSAPDAAAFEVAKNFHKAMVDLDGDFRDVGEAIGAAVLPDFMAAMRKITKIYEDDPQAFAPIARGFEDLATAMRRMSSKDLIQSGRALGYVVRGAASAISGIYSALEFVAGRMDKNYRYPEGKGPAPKTDAGATVKDSSTENTRARDTGGFLDGVAKKLGRTKELLGELWSLGYGSRSSGGAAGGGGSLAGGGAGGPAANIPGFKPSPTGGPQSPADPAAVRQRPGGGGALDPKSYYQMMVEKFRNSKLQGVVPKDAAKWGIKTGSAEEWAALSVAVAQQESSFNPYAPNGGLNQFNADDLARYGLRGRAVTDVDAQGQALVNQWAGSIPKDNVIAGAGPDGKWGGATRYFGSMRRRGEADKYLQWAQGVRDQAERQKQAQDVVGRGEGEVMSAPKKGLPAYMLDDAIKKDGASMEEKLHINVKVRTPKAGYSIRTNSDGESIGSIMTRREFKPETADNGK